MFRFARLFPVAAAALSPRQPTAMRLVDRALLGRPGASLLTPGRSLSSSRPSAQSSNEPPRPASGSNSAIVTILAGLAAGAAGSYLMWFLRDKYNFAPHVPHTPTSDMSGIVAETTSDIAEHLKKVPIEELPVLTDPALFMSMAPYVPPPINRTTPARLIIDLQSTVKVSKLSLTESYEFWTYNDAVPGPFIRCRVGDVLEVRHNNIDLNGIGHNIDFHAVTVCRFFFFYFPCLFQSRVHC
jgi:hypothetical protein